MALSDKEKMSVTLEIIDIAYGMFMNLRITSSIILYTRHFVYI